MPTFLLPGSEQTCPPGARCVGKADPSARFEVTLVVRQPAQDAFARHLEALHDVTRRPPALTREAYAAQYSAAADDFAAVEQFAASEGLQVVRRDAAQRTIVLSGTVAQFNHAFEIDLQKIEHEGKSYRGRVGPVHLPQHLKTVVDAVLGLEDLPLARTHFRLRPAARSAAGFTPLELASIYQFPAGAGKGQAIALIELGGGVKTSDLTTYFSQLGVTPPQVTAVSVDQATNSPTGDPNGPDGEVTLDVEITGAIAPEAHIVLYFAPNTEAGFFNAVSAAVHDTTHRPTVISISWGGPEAAWTRQSLDAFDRALQAAAAMGVTVCAASGDSGSSGSPGNGSPQVDFPASSPHVLACGGTRLHASANRRDAESVWNDGAGGGASGGGVSAAFALPSWQEGLQVTAADGTSQALTQRGVPDVAGDASPASGYDVVVDAQATIVGGTSAVAPLWAGLIARLNASLGKPLGYLNPILYQHPGVLNDITQGDNGEFSAAPGWDACTGLGSPNGQKIAGVA